MSVDRELPDELVDEAWRILCNVSEGDWTKQTPEWQEAVERFREKYHADLDARLKPPPVSPSKPVLRDPQYDF